MNKIFVVSMMTQMGCIEDDRYMFRAFESEKIARDFCNRVNSLILSKDMSSLKKELNNDSYLFQFGHVEWWGDFEVQEVDFQVKALRRTKK